MSVIALCVMTMPFGVMCPSAFAGEVSVAVAANFTEP